MRARPLDTTLAIGTWYPCLQTCPRRAARIVARSPRLKAVAQHIVRSKDLARWEESPVGGGLIMGYPDGDDLGGPDHTLMPNSLFAAHGSARARTLLGNETDDINRSDMDMVTLPSGQTFVTWLSGNQNVPTALQPGDHRLLDRRAGRGHGGGVAAFVLSRGL